MSDLPKCNGAKPACGTCLSANRPMDCEYTDGGRALTEILEEDIAILENRLQALQAGDNSLTLRNPHDARSQAESMAGPISSRSQSGMRDPRTAYFEAQNTRQPQSSNEQILTMLIDKFMRHASQLSFAYNTPRFLSLLRLPQSHPSYPHPALLNSICLWGLRILQRNELARFESYFLQTAKTAITDALRATDTKTRMQAIQAEVLLAQYFYNIGSLVEGQYHATGAVTLAIVTGLHQIRYQPQNVRSSVTPGNTATGSGSYSPHDSEEAEKIALFWAVFSLDKCWSVSQGVPSKISEYGSGSVQIDTPWTFASTAYETYNRSPSSTRGSRKTVQYFLSGRSATDDLNTSPEAMRAQASALLDAVALALDRHSSGEDVKLYDYRSPVDLLRVGSFQVDKGACVILANILPGFMETLSSFNQVASLPPDARAMNVISYSLAHAAYIRLYCARAANDENARLLCIASARAIVLIMERLISEDAEFFDPILCTTWMTAAHIFANNNIYIIYVSTEEYGLNNPFYKSVEIEGELYHPGGFRELDAEG
ncbi:hypothetical protein BD410DRAFT_890300 [Rickenella mellea]|uniref:Xylanolytic transcriptional activator regulatory domain-containing protein n=1 Tax=Rickenella mellea TaxID=50990 RepID=A0A4Y7PN97_9AGAM|nr:hypothetical protein BD410DRAFT_890300 [Rickenella mellea]